MARHRQETLEGRGLRNPATGGIAKDPSGALKATA